MREEEKLVQNNYNLHYITIRKAGDTIYIIFYVSKDI